MIRVADLLGIGIYSPSEAALYARVRPQLISVGCLARKAPAKAIRLLRHSSDAMKIKPSRFSTLFRH